MISSTTSYHESIFSDQVLLGDSSEELEADIEETKYLIAILRQHLPKNADRSLAVYEALLEQENSVLQSHLDRSERWGDDPLMLTTLRNQAVALMSELPIERYLAEMRPGIDLRREGKCLVGHCVYADHDRDEGSFRIFDGDFAWCTGCDRGGNLFRVIGLVEGLPSPFDQGRRAAEVAGYTPPTPPKRSPTSFPPTISHRGSGRKEQFQPIRIVNGRVAS